MAQAPLNSLHGFVAVARRLSFTAAARDLGISASALSQAVRRLEEEVGVPLLHRTSRSVSLTDAGLRLLERAGPAIEQVIEALGAIEAPSGDLAGRVRLSVPTAAVTLVMTRILPRFVALHPRVQLDVRVENGFVDIVAEGLDAGIRLVSSIDRDMVHVRLTPPCRLVVVGSPRYLERMGVPVTPRDLLGHQCLGLRFAPDGPAFLWELGEGEDACRLPVRGPVISNDRQLLRQLALDGVGLLYTLEPLVADELARGELRVVLDDHAQQVPGLFLYFPSRAQVSPALRAFVDVARALADEGQPGLLSSQVHETS